jgi:hypothetical protein
MTSYSPDFIERNGTWLITVLGISATCLGGVLTYFLRSRCTEISCCGLKCVREPVPLTAEQVGVTVQ